jgi:hypothetical protein
MNREVPIMLSGITYSQFWETGREDSVLTYDECGKAVEKNSYYDYFFYSQEAR